MLTANSRRQRNPPAIEYISENTDLVSRVLCKDDESAQWVQKFVGAWEAHRITNKKLRPTGIKAWLKSELPKNDRVLIVAPEDLLQGIPKDKIVPVLMKGNKLRGNMWVVSATPSVSNHTHRKVIALHLGVDDECVKAIRQTGWRLRLLIQALAVKHIPRKQVNPAREEPEEEDNMS